MAKTNTPVKETPKTHEGAPAKRINPEQELRRTLMACMLWEKNFYEDGVSVADRLATLVPKVSGEKVAEMAVEARHKMKLRHAPLWIARHMATYHKAYVADTLEQVIARADELAEFVSLYWLEGKQPLSKQVKLGLARAFRKVDAYQLAKYNRDGKVKLRDVMFLCHPKPKDKEQAKTWNDLANGKLSPPDTWEVSLSGGKDKKETWERLMSEKKLGGMALLRNLRNMSAAKVDKKLIQNSLATVNMGWVLPFRFISAAKAAPEYEEFIDAAMLKNLDQQPKISGRTIIVIDVSGSMYGQTVSKRSDMDRALAASALGAIGREMFEDVAVYATAGSDHTRIHQTQLVPSRRGMALVDAIFGLCRPLGGGGIFLTPVCNWLREREENVERMIVITDEQDCAIDPKDSPNHAIPLGKHNYMLNVNTYKNGIGYGGKWTHIDGWSEAVLNYIREYEKAR